MKNPLYMLTAGNRARVIVSADILNSIELLVNHDVIPSDTQFTSIDPLLYAELMQKGHNDITIYLKALNKDHHRLSADYAEKFINWYNDVEYENELTSKGVLDVTEDNYVFSKITKMLIENKLNAELFMKEMAYIKISCHGIDYFVYAYVEEVDARYHFVLKKGVYDQLLGDQTLFCQSLDIFNQVNLEYFVNSVVQTIARVN